MIGEDFGEATEESYKSAAVEAKSTLKRKGKAAEKVKFDTSSV
jgi:hypothetical protein